MASTGLDSHSLGQFRSTLGEKPPSSDPVRRGSLSVSPSVRDEEAVHEGGNSLKPVSDQTTRRLKPRHIQLIGIGGYVQRDARANAQIVVNADGAGTV